MRIPSVKKLLLAVFIIVLLIAIPVTIYLVSQQKSKTTETPTATLSFVPATQSVNQGDNLSLDVSIDPGKSNISTVSLLIAYDATKLATVDGSFVPNSTAFPSIVSGPTYADGTIAVTLAIGANSPTIQTTTKVGTVNFKALEATDTAPTQITFDSQTNVMSSNGTGQSVLSSASPATVNVAAAAETPTPFPTIADTITPTLTPTPTVAQNQTVSTTGPVCISFTADRPTTGTTPFDVNFTLIATDSAAIISKATFNFGDGQTQDITSANGLGENPTTVNSLALHTYTTTGTFTATGSITDVDGNVSDTGTCSITVNVNSQPTPTSTESAQLTPLPSPLPPTGNNSLTTIAIFGLILTFAGAFILILL